MTNTITNVYRTAEAIEILGRCAGDHLRGWVFDDADRCRALEYAAVHNIGHVAGHLHHLVKEGLSARRDAGRSGSRYALVDYHRVHGQMSFDASPYAPTVSEIRALGYTASLVFAAGSFAHEVADWLARHGDAGLTDEEYALQNDDGTQEPAWRQQLRHSGFPQRPTEVRAARS